MAHHDLARSWTRIQLHGIVEGGALHDHFAQFVTVTDGCWEWTGGKDKNGYGIYRPPGSRKKFRAHRYQFQQSFGWIMDGPKSFVCHKCDNPSCVNPSHLWLGTALENHDDMVLKGRRVHPTQKLTREQVRDIRRRYDGGEDALAIAEAHGITRTHVYNVGKRKVWREVADDHYDGPGAF